jgi:hypothetical protein
MELMLWSEIDGEYYLQDQCRRSSYTGSPTQAQQTWTAQWRRICEANDDRLQGEGIENANPGFLIFTFPTAILWMPAWAAMTKLVFAGRGREFNRQGDRL